MRARSFGTLALALAPVLAGGAAVSGDDPDDRTLAVTVYNGNLGLVRDQRAIDLESGVFTLPFRDVAALIDPTSVAFSALRNPGDVDVLEQNYEFDLLTPQALLEKYVGEMVTLYVPVGENGEERAVTAKLLSLQGGTVYQIGDSIALTGVLTCEPGHRGAEHEHGGEEAPRQRDGERVPPHEAPCPVRDGGRPGEHRLLAGVTLQVGHELLHR